jgi:hypothetical protein
MPLLEMKGELHQVVHCQTQLSIFKFTQIKVQFPINSSVSKKIITFTLNWAHSLLNCHNFIYPLFRALQ